MKEKVEELVEVKEETKTILISNKIYWSNLINNLC